MSKVLVLMSTFNGEKYLREQIESILNQEEVEVKILVRDDGSSDGTVGILQEYKAKNLLDFYIGEKLEYFSINDKIGKSYMELCANADEFDYYAFSDQDDIWLQNKLISAIKLLKENNPTIPLLYCSNAMLTDEKLNQKNLMNLRVTKKSINVERIFISPISPGCTFVFNKNALDKFISYNQEQMDIHDWLMCKVVSVFGKIIFDENSYILYRQHDDNAIGVKREKSTIKQKIKSFINRPCDNLLSDMAKWFYSSYKECMDEKKLKVIKLIAFFNESLKNKWKLVFSTKIKANNLKSTLIFKFEFLKCRRKSVPKKLQNYNE